MTARRISQARLAAALARANAYALAWWRDERDGYPLAVDEANRRLAYGRAQGVATALKVICRELDLELPDGWRDMPEPHPPVIVVEATPAKPRGLGRLLASLRRRAQRREAAR